MPYKTISSRQKGYFLCKKFPLFYRYISSIVNNIEFAAILYLKNKFFRKTIYFPTLMLLKQKKPLIISKTFTSQLNNIQHIYNLLFNIQIISHKNYKSNPKIANYKIYDKYQLIFKEKNYFYLTRFAEKTKPINLVFTKKLKSNKDIYFEKEKIIPTLNKIYAQFIISKNSFSQSILHNLKGKHALNYFQDSHFAQKQTVLNKDLNLISLQQTNLLSFNLYKMDKNKIIKLRENRYEINKEKFNQSTHINSYQLISNKHNLYVANYMPADNFCFYNQRKIAQDIEEIKRIVLGKKEANEEKSFSSHSLRDNINKQVKLDINRLSDQVYKNIERRIRLERERKGI